MLKTYWRLISKIERVADNILIVCAFFLTYGLRDAVLEGANEHLLRIIQELKSLGPINDYFVILAFGLMLFNSALAITGAYRSMRLSSTLQLLRMSATSAAIVFVTLGALLYILKLDLSRSFVGLFCAISALLLFIERCGVLILLRAFRVQGRNFRNILIAGTGDQARRLYLEVMKQRELGMRVVGFVDTAAEDEDEVQAGDFIEAVNGPAAGRSALQHSEVYDLPARVVASVSTFEGALKRHAVDEVLFTDVSRSFPVIEDLAQIAVEEGVSVSLVADFFSLKILKSDTSYFGSIPLIHYRPVPSESTALALKRLLDFIVSGILLVLHAPVMLLVALLIKLDSEGPIFFRQRRVGLNGRIFTLLKFRSMVDKAHELLPELLDQNEMRGPVFKLRNDPRITRVGRFLRRWSLDELPQLINVFRGDMSLVGPRPPLPEEVSLYMRKQRRRLSMRPGITCIWQVSGRNNIPDFEEWAKLDLQYIDNWSLLNDFKLLLKTIPAVISGSGAE